MVNEPENQIDNLTLRRLQESTATPLKTTEERVAYLKGRSDKVEDRSQARSGAESYRKARKRDCAPPFTRRHGSGCHTSQYQGVVLCRFVRFRL